MAQVSKTTVNKYNSDTSLADAYKPQERQAILDIVNKASIGDYAKQQGYDPNQFNADALYGIYKQGADASLAQSLFGVEQSKNIYGQSMNALKRNTIDALRSETLGSVATGTSRAIADANVLKSILGLQQESVADATLLAQQSQKSHADYGEALARALQLADDNSFNRSLSLDQLIQAQYESDQALSANKYAADQQYNSSAYAADSSAYAAALNALLSRVMSSTTTETSPYTNTYNTGNVTGTDPTKTALSSAGVDQLRQLFSGLQGTAPNQAKKRKPLIDYSGLYYELP